MEYEYKVVGFMASVKEKDLRNGSAADKVSTQLASVLEDHAREGWELQGQYRFGVEIKKGCLFGLLGQTIVGERSIEQLVFRRPK